MARPQSPNPLVLTVLIVIGVSTLCCIGCIGLSWLNGALLLSNPGPASTQAHYPTQTLRVATKSFTPTFTDMTLPADTFTPTFTDTTLPRDTFTPEPTRLIYLHLVGLVYSGVKVYYGLLPEKSYAFEILGGSDDCPSMPSGKGIKVRYSNGTEEWKDRQYLVFSGQYFVLKDDPALSKLEWYIYFDCP